LPPVEELKAMTLRDDKIRDAQGVVKRNREKLYIDTITEAQSAPTVIGDTTGFQEYDWNIFAVKINANSDTPSYTIKVYYWDDAFHDFVPGDTFTGDRNRIFPIQTFGKRLALIVTSMSNITNMSVSAMGWMGTPTNANDF